MTTQTATVLWALDDLMQHIVGQVVAGGGTPQQVIDAMWPIRLRPDDEQAVRRHGLISMANDSQGMRGFRSGKFQTATARQRTLEAERDGTVDFALSMLARLVFATAEGEMKSVLDFTTEDADAALARRVGALRDQADREEPFWLAVRKAASKHGKVREASTTQLRALVRLAVESSLTSEV